MANFEIPASHYMSSPLESVGPDDPLDLVHERLHHLDVSALPVVESGRVVGLISRTDLLRLGRREDGGHLRSTLLAFPEGSAGKVMTSDPETIPADAPLSRAAARMLECRHHRIFIEEDGTTVGIVTTRDLMRAIREKRVSHPLSRYMSSPVFTVRASEPISRAVERLEKARIRGLVVVDDEWPVGVFTQVEALGSRFVSGSTPVEEVMSPAILILDPETPIYRAADQASSSDVRRIVARRKQPTAAPQNGKPEGIVTGLDFARVVT